jgi:hypothetical protein
MKLKLIMWLATFLAILIIIPASAEEYSKDEYTAMLYASEQSGNNIQMFTTAAAQSYPVQISNEYLNIAAGGDGSFTLGCTGGDPSNSNDDNKILLFGHPLPWSSESTVKVDGINYEYGTDGVVLELPTNNGNYIQSSWKYGDIRVTQTNSFVTNPSTGRADTMQIKYLYENLDQTESHDVGLRILLDTMLGNNDGAPFQVPGYGAVTMEREFLKSEDQIPDYWQCFDDLSDPTVVSQSTLKGSGATEPDRLIFADWGDFYYGHDWDYPITPSKLITDNSSVGLYWNPTSLGPGETKEYVTYYGLSELSQSAGDIGLSITGPVQLDIIDNQYSPNPFTVVAYVEQDSFNVLSINLTINLPEGLELVSPSETQTIALGSGEQDSVSWTVKALEQTSEKSLTYAVTASAEEMENQCASREITIPKMNSNPQQPPHTEVPEFPTIALPVITIVGLAFMLQHKKD